MNILLFTSRGNGKTHRFLQAAFIQKLPFLFIPGNFFFEIMQQRVTTDCLYSGIAKQKRF